MKKGACIQAILNVWCPPVPAAAVPAPPAAAAAGGGGGGAAAAAGGGPAAAAAAANGPVTELAELFLKKLEETEMELGLFHDVSALRQGWGTHFFYAF